MRPDGAEQASAWRFPTPLTALAGALFAHRLFTVQSRGERTHEVDWCQSAALLVRRVAAQQVDYLDPDFFVYSDEVDFARRLRDAGWHSLYVPGAVAVHHEQLSTAAGAEPRIVELARNRDLYMRKHHSAAAAAAVRWLTAWTYAVRALAALALPGHSAGRYRRHVTATLWPSRGEGLREAAEHTTARRRRAGERGGRWGAYAAIGGERRRRCPWRFRRGSSARLRGSAGDPRRALEVPQGILGVGVDIAVRSAKGANAAAPVADQLAGLGALIGGEEARQQQQRGNERQPEHP